MATRVRLKFLLILVLSLTTAWLLVMAVLSWSFYTSYGVDLEEEVRGDILCTYYRFRWPGNGGFWIGGGAHHRLPGRKPLEPFDPAASAFHPVSQHRLPEPRTFWNRLGFWWIVAPDVDPSNPMSRPLLLWGFWVGVPAWLPVLLTGYWPVRYWRPRPNAVVASQGVPRVGL